MKYIPTIITVLLLLWPLPVSPGEAGIEWDILIQEGQELHRAGQYGRAVTVDKKALEIAEKNVGPDHADVEVSLSNLASLYIDQGRYALAEPLYKRALAIDEQALGPDHPAVATSLNNLADNGNSLEECSTNKSEEK